MKRRVARKDQTSNGQALPVTWETAPELDGTCLSMSDGTPAGWSDCMKTIKSGRCGLKRVAVSANGQITVGGAVPKASYEGCTRWNLINPLLWASTRFDRVSSCECRPANRSRACLLPCRFDSCFFVSPAALSPPSLSRRWLWRSWTIANRSPVSHPPLAPTSWPGAPR